MKQILGLTTLFALVLSLSLGYAQEAPKKATDKEKTCVTKTGEKSGCCSAKSMKAANTTDGKATLTKVDNKTTGCSDKEKAACAGKDKADCASKCSHKHASTDSKDGKN